MNDDHPHLHAAPAHCYRSRREFLKLTGQGFGMLALAGLFEGEGILGAAAAGPSALNPLAARAPHFEAKAKSVIWLLSITKPRQMNIVTNDIQNN